jgi:glycosyltransferase involved in cell wall biosynthesis
LVHVYYGHKAVKYLGMLEAWGGPFIVSFHGVDVVKDLDRIEQREAMRDVFEKAELVLGRSRSLLDEVEKLGCPPAKLRLNRTPIPFSHIAAETREPPADGKWRLIQACRLVSKKGLFTTLEALLAVVRDWPDLKFVLCGTGPVEGRFRQKVEDLGLEGNVEMLGWVDQGRLLEEFHRAHLFVHPSEMTESSDQEGVPNSMLEAMASGLPVVATLHGGIPEAVEHGSTGLLVPEKSPAELSAALRKMLGDARLLREMSRRASASVVENFGLEKQVAILEGCYREAIDQYAARARTGPGG